MRRLFTQVQATIVGKTGSAHMHNTRGLGLANCLAAYDVGVRTFDSSLGGLGGCPYAPGEPVYGTTPEAGLPKNWRY